MIKYLPSIFTLPLLMLAILGYKRQNDVLNYYNIPKTITFGNIDYVLTFSAHPNDNYYKQEYVPHGEFSEHFNKMLLIDFLTTDLLVKDVVQTQMLTLVDRKKTDGVCNYQVVKNEQTGEYILDFIMSESNGNRLVTVEWNAYHYKPYSDKTGHKGVLLFGLSHRAYDDKTGDFLRLLGNYRREILKKLSEYPVPEIQLK